MNLLGKVAPLWVVLPYDQQSSDATELQDVHVRWLLPAHGAPNEATVARAAVHRRKLLTEPVVCISDDKDHDTSFVQHFLHTHIYGPGGWLASKSEDFRRTHDTWLWNSDGAASHFKQSGTMFGLHNIKQQYSLKRCTWMFGAPGHGKGTWDGLGGIIKSACTSHMLRNDITISHAEQFFALVDQLFNSEEKRAEYASRKDIQCREWHIVYTSASETNKLRNSQTPGVEFKTDTIEGFPHKAGTRRLFYFEPLGDAVIVQSEEYRQLALRLRGCYCQSCICAAGRDPTPVLCKQYPKSRAPKLPTFRPGVPGCALQEPWDFQHVRRRRVVTQPALNTPAPTIAPLQPEQTTATEDPSEASDDIPWWAQCELCDKWRTTKRELLEWEYYQCSDTSLTKNVMCASCDAPLEEGA